MTFRRRWFTSARVVVFACGLGVVWATIHPLWQGQRFARAEDATLDVLDRLAAELKWLRVAAGSRRAASLDDPPATQPAWLPASAPGSSPASAPASAPALASAPATESRPAIDLVGPLAERLRRMYPGIQESLGPYGPIFWLPGYLLQLSQAPSGADSRPASGAFEATAWPIERYGTGIAAFALQEDGTIYQSRNSIRRYEALATVPPPLASLRQRDDDDRAERSFLGRDGERWRALRRD